MHSKQKRLKNFLLKAVLFALFQKKLKEDENNSSEVEERDETADFSRIRCPLCRWQPTASSRWFCDDADFPEFYYNGCGTEWNTFATEGVCPGCDHKWRWTTCLSCWQWSLHKDWYEEKSD